MQKRTTTKQLNTAITNNLLYVVRAECHYKSFKQIDKFSSDTFIENLQFLCKSGIFAECIGWHYERDIKTNGYIVECGRMNPDTELIISVYLSVCDGACRENIEKILEVTEEE